MDEKEDKRRNAPEMAAIRTIENLRRTGVFERAGNSANLTKSFDPSGIVAAVKAMDVAGVRALQEAIDPSGPGSLMNVVATSPLAQLGNIDTGIGAALKAMIDRQALFGLGIQAALEEQHRPYMEVVERYRESTVGLRLVLEQQETIRSAIFADTSHLRSTLAELGVGRFGRLLDTLKGDVFGIDQSIARDFLSVSTQISEQFRAINTLAVPKLELDLSTHIAELLTRSIQAHDAILEEQRAFGEEQNEAGRSEQADTHIFRGIVYFQTLIMVLAFSLQALIYYEEMARDDEKGQADRAELVQMREAFEDMSAQLEALQDAEEARADREETEAEGEAAADAELAAIMREIARTLGEQIEHGEDESEVGEEGTGSE